jgi:competence protein ComEA
VQSNRDRRSALLLLALALVGTGVRFVLTDKGAPGAVAYRPVASRPAQAPPSRDSEVARALRLARPLRAGERIDLDVAPVEEIARLPRVGPGLAARIAAEREANGPFGSLDGLAGRVPGVGPSLRTAIQPFADFRGGSSVAVGSSGPRLQPGERLIVGAAEDPPVPARRAAARVHLNTATVAELAKVPGIGRRLAALIVADRVARGPFTGVADLSRVRGITPALIQRAEARFSVP